MSNPFSIPNQRVYAINSPSLNLLSNIGALPKIRQFGTMKTI